MDITIVLIALAMGAVSGWLAGILIKGSGFGLIGDILIGIVGAVIGGLVFSKLGITVGSGIIGGIVSATVGAVLLLVVVGMIKKIL